MFLETALSLHLRGRDGRTQDYTNTTPGYRTGEGGLRLDHWLTETAAAPPMGTGSMFGSSDAGSD